MSVEIRRVVITSDASGDVVETIPLCNGVMSLVKVVNDGTATPTTLWDLAITDSNETAIYTSTTMSIAADTIAIPSITGVGGNTDFRLGVVGSIKVTGANMGDSKTATVIIYLEV